jgi:excisionase family DNA binding protein
MPNKNDRPDEMLTPKDVQRILGVSKQRVHQLIQSGRLKAIKDGGRYKVKLDDVEALKEETPFRRKSSHPRRWLVRISATIEIEERNISNEEADPDDNDSEG